MTRDPNSKHGERLVLVCAECLRASCWHGEFMCDKALNADTKWMKASELDAMGCEHPDCYSEEKIVKVEGGS